MKPQFNEPLYDEVLDITKRIFQPRKSYSKVYGVEPRCNEPRYNEQNIENLPRCGLLLMLIG